MTVDFNDEDLPDIVNEQADPERAGHSPEEQADEPDSAHHAAENADPLDECVAEARRRGPIDVRPPARATDGPASG